MFTSLENSEHFCWSKLQNKLRNSSKLILFLQFLSETNCCFNSSGYLSTCVKRTISANGFSSYFSAKKTNLLITCEMLQPGFAQRRFFLTCGCFNLEKEHVLRKNFFLWFAVGCSSIPIYIGRMVYTWKRCFVIQEGMLLFTLNINSTSLLPFLSPPVKHFFGWRGEGNFFHVFVMWKSN